MRQEGPGRALAGSHLAAPVQSRNRRRGADSLPHPRPKHPTAAASVAGASAPLATPGVAPISETQTRIPLRPPLGLRLGSQPCVTVMETEPAATHPVTRQHGRKTGNQVSGVMVDYFNPIFQRKNTKYNKQTYSTNAYSLENRDKGNIFSKNSFKPARISCKLYLRLVFDFRLVLCPQVLEPVSVNLLKFRNQNFY